MNDIVEFRASIRELEKTLPPGDIYVMSQKSRTKDTTAGCVVCMPRWIAARSIVEATHRLATKAEIEAHEEDQAAKAEAIRKADIERRFPLNLNVYAGQPGEKPRAERTPSK